jgi:competence ComEA-like helix-hairpin-helix protein
MRWNRYWKPWSLPPRIESVFSIQAFRFLKKQAYAKEVLMSEHEELMNDQGTPSQMEPVGEGTKRGEPSTSESAGDAGTVDLNTASSDELQKLPGIGPVLASRIVNYREQVRPFEEPVELTAVQGISESMYRSLADRLTAGLETELETEQAPLAEPGTDVPQLGQPRELETEALEEMPAAEPELQVFEEHVKPEPELLESETVRTTPPPAPPMPQPAPKVGWGRFLFVGLVSAIAGALLALLILLGINSRLDYLGGDALRPVWTRAGELEGRLNTVDADIAMMREQLAMMQDVAFRLDDAQADIRKLSRTMGAVESELAAIHEDLNGMVGDMDAIDERVDAVAEQLDVLAENLSSMRDAVQRFDSFLDTLRHFLNESMGAPTPTPWATSTP